MADFRPCLAEVFSLHLDFCHTWRRGARGYPLSFEMRSLFERRPLSSYSRFCHATAYTSNVVPALIDIVTLSPPISSAFATKPMTSQVTNDRRAEGHVSYL